MVQERSDRRSALRLLALSGASLALAACGSRAAARDWKVSYSDGEWRKRLSASEYRILREAGTERPYSSPLDKEKRAGTFVCAGCGNAL